MGFYVNWYDKNITKGKNGYDGTWKKAEYGYFDPDAIIVNKKYDNKKQTGKSYHFHFVFLPFVSCSSSFSAVFFFFLFINVLNIFKIVW